MFEGVSATVILLVLIALLLLLILITLGAVLIHSGLFITPEVGAGTPPFGKIVLAYKFGKGPYKESGHLFTESVIIAPDKQTLGIYYDDPRKVDASKLRYIAGSIISKDSEPIDEELVKKFAEKGFKILNLPEVEHVVKTSFPYVTTLSIIIGIYKVYPRLSQYIQEKNLCAYPFIEYCDDQTIHYLAPLSKQEDFYAPECEEEKGAGQASPDLNETLETTQSTIADSLQDTTLESNDNLTPSPEKEKTEEKLITGIETLGVAAAFIGEGQGDREVVTKAASDVIEENNGNSDGDVEDNSSSSSFEVVKNEAGDL